MEYYQTLGDLHALSNYIMLAIIVVFLYFLFFDKDKMFTYESNVKEKTIYRGIDMSLMPEGTDAEKVKWIREYKKMSMPKGQRRLPSFKWAQEQLAHWNLYQERKQLLAERDAVTDDDVQEALEGTVPETPAQ